MVRDCVMVHVHTAIMKFMTKWQIVTEPCLHDGSRGRQTRSSRKLRWSNVLFRKSFPIPDRTILITYTNIHAVCLSFF